MKECDNLGGGGGSDVVLETKVLVSGRLEDKNESLSLGSWTAIHDGSEQGTPWHFVRQLKLFAIRKPLFERTCAPCTSAPVERVFNKGVIC